MMARPTLARFGWVLSLVVGIAARAHAGPSSFDHLIVFAGRDHVRIAASFLTGGESGTVGFTGKIARVPSGELLWDCAEDISHQ